ncbi:MAG: type II toxin-antitoxin system VapC family toxin [Spirochaetaceae bacterium]
MRELLLDTSALLFWTLAPERLTASAIQAIDDASVRLISAVSLWEVALKNRKGALELPLPTEEYVDRLTAADRVEISPLEPQVAVAGALLDWDHRDPADRWIVALAQQRGCPIVTSDERIRAFHKHTIW